MSAGRRLCAHADQDGRGMHWLEPGEVCPALDEFGNEFDGPWPQFDPADDPDRCPVTRE